MVTKFIENLKSEHKIAFLVVCLLIGSNCFMTTAWYYHLKKGSWSMGIAIVVSWLIASMEYCLQVPANKLGHQSNGGPFTAAQLKVIQEAISLTIFAMFSTVVLGEKPVWIDVIGFVCIFSGVYISTTGKDVGSEEQGMEHQELREPSDHEPSAPSHSDGGGGIGQALANMVKRIMPSGIMRSGTGVPLTVSFEEQPFEYIPPSIETPMLPAEEQAEDVESTA